MHGACELLLAASPDVVMCDHRKLAMRSNLAAIIIYGYFGSFGHKSLSDFKAIVSSITKAGINVI